MVPGMVEQGGENINIMADAGDIDLRRSTLQVCPRMRVPPQCMIHPAQPAGLACLSTTRTPPPMPPVALRASVSVKRSCSVPEQAVKTLRLCFLNPVTTVTHTLPPSPQPLQPKRHIASPQRVRHACVRKSHLRANSHLQPVPDPHPQFSHLFSTLFFLLKCVSPKHRLSRSASS